MFYIFRDCSGLTSVTIPNSVTSIEDSAFYGCSGLASVTIPNSVTSIEGSAFYGCSGLTSVIIPNGVTSIRERVFSGCAGLTSVSIPNGVTSIGNSAFSGCSNLTSVSIPEGLTSIDDYAFYGCSKLTSVIIPNGVTSIKEGVFYGCAGLTSVSIPNGVTSIGNSAFCGCASLTSISLSEGLTSIDDYAFCRCSSLISVTLPNSVESIGNFAFSGKSKRISMHNYVVEDTSLKSISFGNGIKSIGYNVFDGCRNLESVHISDLSAWCNIQYNYHIGVEVSREQYQSLGNPLAYAHHLYMNGKEVKDLVIPEGVETINSYAFYGCSELTSIRIPNSLKSIGNEAFSGCNELASVHISDVAAWCDIQFYDSDSNPLNIAHHLYLNDEEIKDLIIPNGVKGIGNNLFSGCSELASVTIGDDVTTISWRAFKDCTKLSSVNLGKSVSEIGSLAFANCENINYVTCYAKSVPNASSDAFENSHIEYAILHVNASSIDAYRETDPWNKFHSIVAIESQKYTLTYTIGGEVYKTVQYVEGETITPEETPQKDGYTFSGWSEIPETMPSHDVTITGSFERVYSGGDVANLINLLLFGNVNDEDIALYDMNGDGELNIGDLILIMRAAQNNSRNRSAANRAGVYNLTIGLAA